MAAYKNQHFVPKCYLKYFSSCAQKKSIHLFNNKRENFIETASLKKQCARSYFYSREPDLEVAINKIENLYSQTVTSIFKNKYSTDKVDAYLLSFFTYFQYHRTEMAAKQAAASISSMQDITLRGVPMADPPVSEKEAAIIALKTCTKTKEKILDLEHGFIINETGRDFITSDDPAVFTNRWHIQAPNIRHQSVGAASSGAVYLLPITPELCFILYDKDVYYIPMRSKKLFLRSVDDVDALNIHQMINCNSNIYFSRWSDRSFISNQYSSAKSRRLLRRYDVFPLVKDPPESDHYRRATTEDLAYRDHAMIVLKFNLANPGKWPSFLKFRRDKRIYYNGSAMGYLRPARIFDEGDVYPPFRRVR